MILPQKYYDTKFNYDLKKAKFVPKNFHYTSEITNKYLNISELLKLVRITK